MYAVPVPHRRLMLLALALVVALLSPSTGPAQAATHHPTKRKATPCAKQERTARKKKACAARVMRTRTVAVKVVKPAVKKPVRKPVPAPAPAPAPSGSAPAPATGTPTDGGLVPAVSSPAPSGPATGAGAPAPATRLYADSSPFNTPIGASPAIAANSAAMVAKSLLPYRQNANFANSDWWGISIVDARASDPLRQIGVFDWGYGADIAVPSLRIPDSAQPTLGSDHHLVVLDGDREADMWVAERQADGGWMAGARAATSTKGSGVVGPIAGNAAGFALAAGVVRPEEIAAGRIRHALVFTSPDVRNGFVAPAVHGDGKQTDPDAMPMGTRIQLNPAADISRLPAAQRIIAQALKDYGAYLGDSSGSLALRGEASIGRASTGGPADIWSSVGVTDAALRTIPWDQMRVVTG
jgi:hypothetical protein